MRFLLIALLSISISVASAMAYSSGPPNGSAGNPPNNNNCTQCHTTYPVNFGNGSLSLTGLPVGGYQSNTTYHLTLTLQDPGQTRWGFELTPIYQSGVSYLQAGEMTVTQTTYTQLAVLTGTAPDYLKQTSAGTFAGTAGPTTWQFDWTSPNTSVGNITFYIAGAAANNDTRNTGDYIYTTSVTTSPYVPQPPVVGDIPNQTISLTGIVFFDSLNLNQYVTDPDTPDSLINWACAGYEMFGVQILQGIAYFSPLAIFPQPFGVDTLTFTATDPNNLSDSDIAIYTITNNPPVVSNIPNVSFNSNSPCPPTNLSTYISDPEEPFSSLILNISGDSTFVTASIQTGILTFNQNIPNWYGSGVFIVTATDIGGLSDSDSISVNILNLPPVIEGVPDQTIHTGEAFTVINLASYCSDPNHPVMELDWSVNGNIDLTVEIMGAMATITPPDSVWTGSEALIFTVTDPGGLSDSDTATFTVLQLGVPYLANPEIPNEFALRQNYPNPFNNSTTISFDLPHSAYMNLTLYNIEGRIARNLVGEYLEAGIYHMEVDLTELPSGIYFYSMNAGNFQFIRKLVMLK
jgi:hypothetical protein